MGKTKVLAVSFILTRIISVLMTPVGLFCIPQKHQAGIVVPNCNMDQ